MILAATGLKYEAKIIARPGVVVRAGGGASEKLEQALDDEAPNACAIISVGLAGALNQNLRVGDWVVSTEDIAWRDFLLNNIPNAQAGAVIGSDAIMATPDAKQLLERSTGALACDMESHIAARVATRHRLPFATLRVISDNAATTLPPAARAGMRIDGSMDIAAVALSLARSPGQLIPLLRIAWDAKRAFRSLSHGYDALFRVGIYPPNLGKLPVHMA